MFVVTSCSILSFLLLVESLIRVMYWVPVQDLTPNSSSFTDADIIFNILLTSPINYISVECQC